MIIYNVNADVDTVQTICPSQDINNELFAKLNFDGYSKIDSWVPIEFFVFNPLAKKANFFSLTNSGAFACDKRAADCLWKFLDFGIELLPIYLDDGTELFIVNVIDCVNALDQKNTVFDYYSDETRGRILKYVFHDNLFSESSVFKIPETANTQVLTYTGVKSPEEEFYTAYSDSKIEGLVFDVIYSNG